MAFGLVIVKARCGRDCVGAAKFTLGAVDHATADAEVDAIARTVTASPLVSSAAQTWIPSRTSL
jgi:N-acetylglutamate synthase/N-acetylornithine aminotransferase